MDHQASTLRKIAPLYTLLFVSGLLLTLGDAFAQVENPLSHDIIITASVAPKPNQFPDTPPVPPGPINMIDTTDSAVFRGLAYPGSNVSLLKNGTVVATVTASPNGTFDIRLRGLSQGTYSFGVRAEDSDHISSKLLLFTIYVSQGVTTTIDGIFLPPTITSDKIEVKRGDTITFLGKAAPGSEVRLSLHSDSEIIKKTQSNASGTWIYKLDSSELALGDHEGKARSITEDDLSLYSDTLSFRVSNTNRLRAKAADLSGVRKQCDLNSDNRVNILDFSIMAFWYKRTGFPSRIDLNTDGKINLTDLSILAYCWTG